MLLELFRYFTIRCSPALRKIGFLHELLAIEARYKRRREAWRPHLEETKRLILDAAQRCPRRRTALILGSGICLDVPLAELAASFERVILADILHLPQARKLANAFPNVELATMDVTGLVEEIYALDLKRATTLPRRRVDFFQDEAGRDIDFVASVNLLSQLPTLLGEYIGHKTRQLPQTELDRFNQDLLRNHLDWLHRFPCPVCLSADLKRSYIDAQGQLIEEVDALQGLTLPYQGRTWFWTIAPIPELDPAYARVNTVLGVLDIRAAWSAPCAAPTTADLDIA
jgi:hypothetical protein